MRVEIAAHSGPDPALLRDNVLSDGLRVRRVRPRLTKRHELRRGVEPQHLEPQVCAVLCHLVEHHDRLVTSKELIEHVWGNRFVTPATLNSRIKALRQASSAMTARRSA